MENGISGCIPARYILAVLGSISFIILYGLKVNLSMTIVYMVNTTKLDSANSSNSENLRNVPDFFVAVALNIIGTLLTPVIAEYAVVFLIFRTLEGIGGGFSFPATHVLLSKWAPVEERSIMSAIIYAGSALGTVLSMLFSGLIINWLDWQSVFYIMGSLPLIWCILWIWLIQDDPIKQQYITEQERSYIVKSIRKTEEKHKISVPWKDVWTSVPFLVIINAHFCNNTCWYFLLTELPTYMFKVLHFDLENNKLMSSLPYLTLWIFSLALSKCLDFGRSNNKITTTTARKISTAFATLIPAACLIAVNFSSDSYVVAGLMAIAVTAMGAMFTGVLTNHIDIAPEFAGEEQPWNRIKTNNTSTILEDKEKQ
ncbi:Sialin [Blattella germanica]|nr:Sialin [Blattella germanica]